MGEYRNRAAIGNKLADKLKSLRAKTRTDKSNACDVVLWSIQAANQTCLDWIERDNKYNRN
jgi:hypothetical protein